MKRATLHLKSVGLPKVNGPDPAPPGYLVTDNNINQFNHDSLVIGHIQISSLTQLITLQPEKHLPASFSNTTTMCQVL